MKKSVSIIVSAYNEEKDIKDAVSSILKALAGMITDYEIIIVDDGSTDQTLSVIKKEIKENNHISLIHHTINKGVGVSFRDGLVKARKKYVTVFPGDNDMSSKSLKDLFQKIDSADLIISYPTNQRRPFIRKLLSSSFTKVLNLLFKLNVKYYNGPFIVKLSLLKNLKLKSTGFLIFAELKLRLIRKGFSFIEIPFEHVGRKHGQSKALSFSNLVDTLKTIIWLVADLNS